MSLIITVYCSEGIVMASDSRSTYSHTERIEPSQEGQTPLIIEHNGIHFTDTAYKTFISSNGVGVSTCGASSINGKPITGLIEEFLRIHSELSVTNMACHIHKFFQTIAPYQSTEFIIAGYEEINDKTCQKIYRANTTRTEIENIDTDTHGAIWGGENDILSRILTELYLKETSTDGNTTYTPHVGYPILWNYFTLQDCIDFAEYAIKTTIDTMRFQGRVKTVGGPIDILVIKPSETIWIAHKDLHTTI